MKAERGAGAVSRPSCIDSDAARERIVNCLRRIPAANSHHLSEDDTDMARMTKRAALATALVSTTLLSTTLLSSASAQDAGQLSIDQLQSVSPVIGGGVAPLWSADGRSLVYIGGGALWSIGADGGEPTRLSEAPASGTQMRRTSDGRLITYVKDVPGGNDIFGWDVAAKAERRISKLSGRVRSYSLSPDGRSIALANDRNGSEDIWVVNVADGAARRITSSPMYEVFPSWSSDEQDSLHATRLALGRPRRVRGAGDRRGEPAGAEGQGLLRLRQEHRSAFDGLA